MQDFPFKGNPSWWFHPPKGVELKKCIVRVYIEKKTIKSNNFIKYNNDYDIEGKKARNGKLFVV